MGTKYQPLDAIIIRFNSSSGKSLLLADENWFDFDWGKIPNNKKKCLLLLTNRFDIYRTLIKEDFKVIFNDFNFSSFETNHFKNIFFRISKEKLINLHVIQESKRLLENDGKLFLTGKKIEGIKSLSSKANLILSGPMSFTKNGSTYLSETIKVAKSNIIHLQSSYHDLQSIEGDSNNLSTKAGIFGWNKVDEGSRFLIDTVPIYLSHFNQPPETLLDLGCGYGYLSVCASRFNFKRIIATDNNAGALIATERNLARLKIEYEVIGDDSGESIKENFDSIWSNPPFHSGFSLSTTVLNKFLKSSKNLLKPSGKCLFVVNKFIPIEKLASNYFKTIEILNKNNSFKVVLLSA
tara:strand:- start:486 stop:1538 length:1053 start_codon:yes stop_codon:yes gene_type:complete